MHSNTDVIRAGTTEESSPTNYCLLLKLVCTFVKKEKGLEMFFFS